MVVKTKNEMTVKELKEALAAYPDDMEVVFDVFEEGSDAYNFVDGAYVHKDRYSDEYLHLYED